MEHTYDEDTKTASILAYCIDFNPEVDDTDDTKPDEAEDDTEDTLTQNVTERISMVLTQNLPVVFQTINVTGY